MKNHLVILALTIMTLGISSKYVCGQSPFFWGNVKWSTGYPAIGMEVRLVRNDSTVRSTVYTDQAGSYAFFGIEGRPSEYYVKVYDRKTLLGQIKVPAVPAGRQVPDIKLTNQLLRVQVTAFPRNVTTGQRTIIKVAVQDGNGKPVPDASVSISAGGGKFLKPNESYDPRTRLHGPYRSIGLTNANGIYTTSWVCNPCASAYVLYVEGNKSYYISGSHDLTIDIGK